MDYRRRKVRTVFAYLRWIWYKTAANGVVQDLGHLTLLVFDTLNQTYNLFDPNYGQFVLQDGSSWNRYNVLVDATTRNNPLPPIVPNYRPIQSRQQGPVDIQGL